MFTQVRLGLEDAERARDAVLAALTPADSPAALAIVDEHGVPILLLRQDGAPTRMLGRARAKAYTAANLGLNTVVFRDAHVKARQRALDDWGDAQLTTLQGGLAIRHNRYRDRGDRHEREFHRTRRGAGLGRPACADFTMISSLSVGLADARLGVDAVLAAARRGDGPLAISIVDPSGAVVYQLRQDGAAPVDVRNAERKAITAAYIGRDTSMWRLQIRMTDARSPTGPIGG